MNRETFFNNLSDDTGVFFYTFDQDNDVIIAKSHFFDLRLGPTYIELVDSYVLPGPILKNYLQEKLPFRIDFIVENYYDILVDTIDEIHDNSIAAEYRDEEEE